MVSSYSDFSSAHVESEGTSADLEGSFRLRYKTYCLEKGFLEAGDPNEREHDRYDMVEGLTHHFVVTNRVLNNDVVGTARLINHSKDLGFPTETRFPQLFETMWSKVGVQPLEKINEFSRLCIDERFRRRKEPLDMFYGLESYMAPNPDVRRKYPIILIHLMRKVFQSSVQRGVTYWVTSIEDVLWRFLEMYGVVCIPLIDGYIDFYGQVKPIVIDVDKTLAGISAERPDVFSFFQMP